MVYHISDIEHIVFFGETHRNQQKKTGKPIETHRNQLRSVAPRQTLGFSRLRFLRGSDTVTPGAYAED